MGFSLLLIVGVTVESIWYWTSKKWLEFKRRKKATHKPEDLNILKGHHLPEKNWLQVVLLPRIQRLLHMSDFIHINTPWSLPESGSDMFYIYPLPLKSPGQKVTVTHHLLPRDRDRFSSLQPCTDSLPGPLGLWVPTPGFHLPASRPHQLSAPCSYYKAHFPLFHSSLPSWKSLAAWLREEGSVQLMHLFNALWHPAV